MCLLSFNKNHGVLFCPLTTDTKMGDSSPCSSEAPVYVGFQAVLYHLLHRFSSMVCTVKSGGSKIAC